MQKIRMPKLFRQIGAHLRGYHILSITLPNELDEKVEKASKELGITPSQWLSIFMEFRAAISLMVQNANKIAISSDEIFVWVDRVIEENRNNQ